MSHEHLTEHLSGVLFTTTTPFSENGAEILHDEINRNVQAVLDAGGRSFIPCGNTGEFHSLTREERRAVVETTIDTVGDEGAVIAGVGGPSRAAIKQIDLYEELGVDGVMVHGLDHTYRHQRGIVEYYRKLADSTDLGIVLYKRTRAISRSVLEDLASVENVIGVKFAVNDVAEFPKTVAELSGDLVFCTGNAERFAPSFALEGARGFTTGIGSFVPEATLALQQALEHEEWHRAREIRDLLRPLEDLREETGANNSIKSANNVPVVKYGLELAGLYGGPVREPLVELSKQDKERVERQYHRVVEATSISGLES